MYIKIHVTTKARKERVEKVGPDHWNIWVKEAPVRSLANQRILEIMRMEYPGVDVRLVSGHQSPRKIVRVGE